MRPTQFIFLIMCVYILARIVSLILIIWPSTFNSICNNKNEPLNKTDKDNHKVKQPCNATFKSHHIIIFDRGSFTGRLGNNMFQLFTLLSTAKTYCFRPVLNFKFLRTPSILDIFHLDMIDFYQGDTSHWHRLHYRNFTYVTAIEHLDTRYNWSISGYFQSWKYLNNNTDYLRSIVKFKEPFNNTVKLFFSERNITHKTKIGIHVRRGDFLKNEYRGASVASVEYIKRAMHYYNRRFSDVTLIFLVASDDLDWCRHVITDTNVIFSPFKGRNAVGEDMAMLSHCDHSIITSGTYSWMSGWLAGGDVVYYKNFPMPGSLMALRLNVTDYYPPQWIGIT